MASEELHYLPISQVARLIRNGKVSCLEVTEAAWARIDQVNPMLNAFITTQREESLLAAEEADRSLKRNGATSPLHGIPISLKDLYDTAGLLTTAGSRTMADRVPDRDATVVRRLREAGSILLGKVGMSAFACGGTDSVFGDIANPWDITRYPGGSSSGSGASVASGMSYASMGSDTGGSIRTPASLSGVVGMKATYGRVSRYGVVTLSWTLDHAGPLTRTVRDAAIVLQTIAGHDPLDVTSSRERVPNFSRGIARSLEGRTLAVPRQAFYQDLDPQVAAAIEEALRVLQRLGARLKEVELPTVSLAQDSMVTIMQVEGAAYHWERVKDRLDELAPKVRSRITRGVITPAITYIQAHRIRTILIEEFRQAMNGTDAMVLPTTAKTAPRLDEVTPNKAITPSFNMTGLPALSVPCGFTRAGLPIGMQIAGHAFDEATVFNIGHAYETATDWHARRPTL